jgi:hypothetical protein
MRNRRSLKLQAAVVFAAIAAALSAALVLDAFSGAALARVKEAWAADGTIHARFYSSQGDLVAEEWLDRRSGKTRRVQVGGDEGDEITVQDGKRSVTWNSLGLGAVYETVAFDASDPWLTRSSSLLRFKRLVEGGHARIVGTRSAGGRKAIVVRTESGPDEPGAPVEIALDDETLLPIEAAAQAVDGPSVFRVESEELSEPLPKAFYAPERKASIVDRRLRASQLRSLPFRTYTLSSPPRGLRPATFGVREQSDPEAPFKLEPHLFVGYTQGRSSFADPALELVERAADTDQAQTELGAFADAEVRSISVRGDAVDVYVLGDDEGPVAFALTRERTLISGHSDLPVDVTLAALATLKAA